MGGKQTKHKTPDVLSHFSDIERKSLNAIVTRLSLTSTVTKGSDKDAHQSGFIDIEKLLEFLAIYPTDFRDIIISFLLHAAEIHHQPNKTQHAKDKGHGKNRLHIFKHHRSTKSLQSLSLSQEDFVYGVYLITKEPLNESFQLMNQLGLLNELTIENLIKAVVSTKSVFTKITATLNPNMAISETPGFAVGNSSSSLLNKKEQAERANGSAEIKEYKEENRSRRGSINVPQKISVPSKAYQIYPPSRRFVEVMYEYPYLAHEDENAITADLGFSSATSSNQKLPFQSPLSTNFSSFESYLSRNHYLTHTLTSLFNQTFLRPYLLQSFPPSLLQISQDRQLLFSSPFIMNGPSRLLRPPDLHFISYHLPAPCRQLWTLLFSSSRDGQSWSTFQFKVQETGSLLLIVKDKGGNIFMGFASEPIEAAPGWQGSSECWVGMLRPKIRIWKSSGVNDNYLYFNSGAQTLPNGIGWGGQQDYHAIWISSDFSRGHSKAHPRNSTYNSPQLSSTEFFEIDEVECFQVYQPPKDDDDYLEPDKGKGGKGKASVLARNTELTDFLELAGRTMYTKELGITAATSELESNVFAFDEDDEE